MTIEELNSRKNFLINSGFSHGNRILFEVMYSYPSSWRIHSDLFSTAERALKRYLDLSSYCNNLTICPVADIWDNPDQVDIM